jgi:DNA-binding GntR family transcriptional regulator
MVLLKPVERPIALGGRVYQALRANIRSGKFAPGQPLQEVQLAAQLGVSRTPVREALARLASEGLVSSDGRSFVVPSLTLADIDDIYEVRGLIEPEALRHVAQRAQDPAAVAPITEALEASVAAHKAGDNEAFMEANARFRNAWLACVSNARLVHAVEMYADHVQHLRTLTLEKDKVRTVVLRGLKRIAAAVAAGDGDAAAAAMREHLNEARKAFISALGLEASVDADAEPARKQKKASAGQ